MMPEADQYISLALRALLLPLAAQADIPKSDALGKFIHVLERFLPDLLAQEHVWFWHGGFDELLFTSARKVGREEAEFFGYAYGCGHEGPVYFAFAPPQKVTG